MQSHSQVILIALFVRVVDGIMDLFGILQAGERHLVAKLGGELGAFGAYLVVKSAFLIG
jgi:hypothetical protein